MKLHTTNYFDTFIEVAEDCPTDIDEIPKPKGNIKTVAEMQFELVLKNPYKYTSDDILFQVYADRNDLTKSEYKEAREHFFSKGQQAPYLDKGKVLEYLIMTNYHILI